MNNQEIFDEYEGAPRNIPIPPLTPDRETAEDEGEDIVPVETEKKKKRVFVWKDDIIYFVINLWQQESILYNTKDPNYSNKIKRASANKRIYDGLKEKSYIVQCLRWTNLTIK